jgi:hypothetical protein
VDADVFAVDRTKRSRAGFLQCNAVRSVHEDGWQREAARAVVSDVTGRPWVGAVTRNAKRAREDAKCGECPGLTMQPANPLGKWFLQIAAGARERQGPSQQSGQEEVDRQEKSGFFSCLRQPQPGE